ncbi:hypothetical protein ACFONC_03375 [Luteimonas soli]|uniref:Helix-turn-helix domain-containing protein n=1 Tax=Luteimonas soli TaxID=1648966 RepID=A0ABV7XH39_9GAMM
MRFHRHDSPFPPFLPAMPDRRPRSYTQTAVHTTGTGTVNLAVRLALRFGGRPPSVAHLCAEFGMSRATAYRWRRAFLDALGLP